MNYAQLSEGGIRIFTPLACGHGVADCPELSMSE